MNDTMVQCCFYHVCKQKNKVIHCEPHRPNDSCKNGKLMNCGFNAKYSKQVMCLPVDSPDMVKAAP